jgi:hypothetical protein
MGLEKGHSFCLGLHTSVFQDEIHAFKACIMENIEKGYKVKNTVFFLRIKQLLRPMTVSR